MHVQFATQNFLQVYGNPGNNMWKEGPRLKSFLVGIRNFTPKFKLKFCWIIDWTEWPNNWFVHYDCKSWTSTGCDKQMGNWPNGNRCRWKQRLRRVRICWFVGFQFSFLSNGFSFSFLTSEMTKSLEAAQRKFQYVPKFAKQMMDIMAESNAFPYPQLLPKIPFRMDYRDKGHLSEFVPIED